MPKGVVQLTGWDARGLPGLVEDAELKWASQVAQWLKKKKKICLPVQDMQETLVLSLGGEDPTGGGNGNPLQYSCLESPTDRGACGLQSTRSERVRYD